MTARKKKYTKLSVLRPKLDLHQGPELTDSQVISEAKYQFEKETDQDQEGESYLPSEATSLLQTKMKS